MKSKQFPSEVYVLRKRVNLLRKQVNIFRVKSQPSPVQDEYKIY